MDLYHIVLFLHITTLLVAAGATVAVKIAIGRRTRARTVGEALEWHNSLISASKVFPMCLAAFVITGSYMVSVIGRQNWSNGFVVAGLVGVALLLSSGTYLGVKGKVLKQVLENMAAAGADRPAPKMAPPLMLALLPMMNTLIALSVAFDMVTKPASIPVALGVIAVGAILGAMLGARQRAAHSVQESEVVPAA